MTSLYFIVSMVGLGGVRAYVEFLDMHPIVDTTVQHSMNTAAKAMKRPNALCQMKKRKLGSESTSKKATFPTAIHPGPYYATPVEF